jgi:hypothetical protein
VYLWGGGEVARGAGVPVVVPWAVTSCLLFKVALCDWEYLKSSVYPTAALSQNFRFQQHEVVRYCAPGRLRWNDCSGVRYLLVKRPVARPVLGFSEQRMMIQ